MTDRTPIQAFELANPIYRGASVTFYTVLDGVKTATKATLYEAPTGTDTLANPQMLDSDGKFVAPVYIDEAVIGAIAGLTIGDHDTGIIQDIGSAVAEAASPYVAAAGAFAAMAGRAKRDAVLSIQSYVQLAVGQILGAAASWTQRAGRYARDALYAADNARSAGTLAAGMAANVSAKIRSIPGLVVSLTYPAITTAAGFASAAATYARQARTARDAAAVSAAAAAASAGTFDQGQNVLNSQVFS